jgi:hypothetical protein
MNQNQNVIKVPRSYMTTDEKINKITNTKPLHYIVALIGITLVLFNIGMCVI